jgi:hypothetical protein
MKRITFGTSICNRGSRGGYQPTLLQVNLDFSSEADMIRKFRASLALQPVRNIDVFLLQTFLVLYDVISATFKTDSNSSFCKFTLHKWKA